MRAAQTAPRRPGLPMLRPAVERPHREHTPQTESRAALAFGVIFLAGYLPGIWLGRSGTTPLGQHLAARSLHLAVGQAPVRGQPLTAGACVPFGQHLVGEAQPRGAGRYDAALQLGQVDEGVVACRAGGEAVGHDPTLEGAPLLINRCQLNAMSCICGQSAGICAGGPQRPSSERATSSFMISDVPP